MTIIEKQRVLAAVQRALLIAPAAGEEAAIATAAQALGLQVEIVAAVVRERDAEVSE